MPSTTQRALTLRRHHARIPQIDIRCEYAVFLILTDRY